jgi:hypothetical protein
MKSIGERKVGTKDDVEGGTSFHFRSCNIPHEISGKKKNDDMRKVSTVFEFGF